MATVDRIHNALHESEFVYIDKDTELAYVWNGSLTINIYRLLDWTEVDMFTLGEDYRQYSGDYVPHVQSAIERRIEYTKDY